MSSKKPSKITDIAQAFGQVDDDVSPASTRKAHSLISQIEALEVDECASRVQQADGDMTLQEYADSGADLRAALRNSVNASMRAAKARTGGTYEVEVSDMMTTGRKLYIVAIITRTA